MSGRLAGAAMLALFLLIVYLPIAALAGAALWGEQEAFGLALPLERRVDLLLASVVYAAVVAAAAMAISIASAVFALSRANGWPRVFRWLMVLMVPVPVYIHAMAWMPLSRTISLLAPAGWGNWAGAVWVQTLALVPLGVCISLLALESVDGRLLDAARIAASPGAAFGRVMLPLAAPALVAGGALLFLLSLVDYTAPSLFSVNTYPLEVFAEFSVRADAGRAALVAVPVVVVAALAGFGALAPLRSAAMRQRQRPSAEIFPAWLQAGGKAGAAAAAVSAGVVLFSLVKEGASPAGMWKAMASAGGELAFSFAIAAGCGAAGVLLAIFPAMELARAEGKGGNWRAAGWWAAVVLPLAVPAPLIGAGLIAVWNRPGGDLVYGTWAMPVLASLARFLPLAAIVLAAFLRRVDPVLLDAGRVFQQKPAHGGLRVWAPLMGPGVLAAGGVLFAMTLGELGATVLVAPPGQSTLSIRIYNYLHFGASETVAALSLVVALAALAGGWTLARMART